jgi:hypothetical protein
VLAQSGECCLDSCSHEIKFKVQKSKVSSLKSQVSCHKAGVVASVGLGTLDFGLGTQ